MVFQKYALFPHLSVFENVAFGLKVEKVAAAEIRDRVREVLSLVNLSDFADRAPETLSGGQAQRVALARALVKRPECVLLDEPLTALDQKLRERMQTELRLLQKRLGLTFIFVTHDQEEAMLMSDRIAVMNAGQIEQIGTPREIFEAPQTAFCARFIGRHNEIRGTVRSLVPDALDIAIEGLQPLRVRSGEGAHRVSDSVSIFVRPERLRVGGGSGENKLGGRVLEVFFRGVQSEAAVELQNGQQIRVVIEAAQPLEAGQTVELSFAPHEARLFSAGPS
jgi:spermidine/putrescine transport system ATP-binding protein